MLIATPRGDARVNLFEPKGKARCLVALGHGAGGDVDAPDIVAVKDALVAAKVAVALVTQPYRVAGRKAAAPAGQLDEAWRAVIAELRKKHKKLIVGGRSSGARVACRTAKDTGAVGVIALAFPLHPPGKPEKSRDSELRECGVPAIVVNGSSDPFGVPEPGQDIDLVVIPGARHDLRKDLDVTAKAVADWVSKHT